MWACRTCWMASCISLSDPLRLESYMRSVTASTTAVCCSPRTKSPPSPHLRRSERLPHHTYPAVRTAPEAVHKHPAARVAERTPDLPVPSRGQGYTTAGRIGSAPRPALEAVGRRIARGRKERSAPVLGSLRRRRLPCVLQVDLWPWWLAYRGEKVTERWIDQVNQADKGKFRGETFSCIQKTG
jgi:hypothetical protein